MEVEDLHGPVQDGYPVRADRAWPKGAEVPVYDNTDFSSTVTIHLRREGVVRRLLSRLNG